MEFSFKFGFNRSKEAKKIIEKSVPDVSSENSPVLIDEDNSLRKYIDRENYFDVFYLIPEVAFPILYVTSRMKNANVVLRRYEDDSEVWSDSTRRLYGDEKLVSDFARSFLESPNFMQSFSEFTEQYFLQRYLTGCSFIYAAGSIAGVSKWRTCKNFNVIPSDSVSVDVTLNQSRVLVSSLEDYINGYKLTLGGKIYRTDTNSVLFTRDIQALRDNENIKGYSRLRSQQKCIDNLIEVYDARLAIYNKRGGIGALVNQKQDVDGALPMTQAEREAIYKEFQQKYGITHNRMPVILLDKPMNYIRMAANISELEPFRETMLDGAAIASIFQIKKELLPREGNSTYANQEEAEISVYNDMVIPEMKCYLDNLTKWLGLNEVNVYLDAKWDNVEVLKKKKKEGVIMEDTKLKLELAKFKAGACTLNEALGQLGMEARDLEIYNKTVFEMTPEELAKLSITKQI